MIHRSRAGIAAAGVIALLLIAPLPVRAQEAAAPAPVPSPQSVDALLRLGDFYSDFTVNSIDYPRAYAYYEQAAAAGSQSAQLRMAEMLVRGQGVAQDVKRGLRMLEALAADGGSNAMVSLAVLYSQGNVLKMDPAKALKYYESAAALGNSTAMLRLGEIYLYGQFGPENPKKALPYFRRAADQGNAWGLYSLGKMLADGILPKAGTREQGIALLHQAEDAGIEDATIGLSDTYFQIAKDKPGIRTAMAILESAAAKGNVAAALELLSIYRDGKWNGNRLLVKRNMAAARSYFAKVQANLSPSEKSYQLFLLDASEAGAKAFAALGKRFDALPEPDRSSALRDVHRAKMPIYVFLVQRELAQRGVYSGKVNGRVDKGTLRALSSYCMRQGTPYFCKDGPMSSRVAELIARSL